MTAAALRSAAAHAARTSTRLARCPRIQTRSPQRPGADPTPCGGHGTGATPGGAR